MAEVVQVPSAQVILSTASCYPESCTTAFEMAGRLGYDGVEVMVWTDPVSQDVGALARLAEHYSVPVLAVHAPCLLLTQRVWGTDPWEKLERSVEAARELGAGTVIVHPPFRWQRDYAREFGLRIALLEERTGVRLAVENMYPWRAGRREVEAYAPHWNPVGEGYRYVTLDLSHTAVSGTDALELLDALGDRMVHLHLADGSGSNRDEHLIPGRGTQPCAEVLERLATRQFSGLVALEVNTRRAPDRDAREAELA
ncbi:MAG: sugar phosphate isomerase/epimerase, partial [Actinomycetota bacterium]|nr:sugar phosphate isomerase/epimerase [Actinomycetota bacterium]